MSENCGQRNGWDRLVIINNASQYLIDCLFFAVYQDIALFVAHIETGRKLKFIFLQVMVAVEAESAIEMLNVQRSMALSNVSVKKALWAAGLSVLVRHA